MTPEKQKAESRKYCSDATWLFNEIEPGLFVLYSPIRREVKLITDDWNELLEAYRAREPFVPVRKDELKAKKIGVDLSKVEFKI